MKAVEQAAGARPTVPGAPERVSAQAIAKSRPLLLLERTMYRDGRTPFTLVFTIKLLGVLDEARLRQALARVQAKHPLLRCLIEDTVVGPRFVMQERPAAIPLRIVARTGDDDWQAEARREWVVPFDASCNPLVRLVWLRAGEVNELLLVAHHCICDGKSGINFLRECLRAYDQPERDIGVYHALGTVEDLVPAELLRNPRFQRRVRWKVRLLRLFFFVKRRPGAKPGNLRIAPEQMYFHRWQLGKVASVALIDRCKAEEVTILAAVSVAFLQAFRDVRGVGALNKAYTMVNARRFMPRLRADAMFGIAPGVALRMKGLPPPQDMSAAGFWERARALKADLTRRVDRLGANLFDYLVGLERLHAKYDRLVDDTEGAREVRHLTLSNVGRVDLPRQYRNFRLETFYSPLGMVSPTPANTVVISSFAGRLEFSIISDERSLPQAQALAIKQRAMEIFHTCAAMPPQDEPRLDDEPSAMRTETT